MPTVIDELVVKLGLDSSQFDEGEQRLMSSLRRMENAAERGGKQVVETTGRGALQFFRTIESPMAGLRHYFEGAAVQTVVFHERLRELGDQGKKTGEQVQHGLGLATGGMRAFGIAGLAAFAAYEALNKTFQAATGIAGNVFGTGLGARAAGMGITEFGAISQVLFAGRGGVSQEETQNWLANFSEMQGQAALGQAPGRGFIAQLNNLLGSSGIIQSTGIDPYHDSSEQLMVKLARGLAAMPEQRAYAEGRAMGLSRPMVMGLREEGLKGPGAFERDIAAERARAPKPGDDKAAADLLKAEHDLAVAWNNVLRALLLGGLADRLIQFANFLSWLLNPAQPGDTRNWWQRHAPNALGGQDVPLGALGSAPSSAAGVVGAARAAGANDSATAVILSAAMGEGAPNGDFSNPWVTNKLGAAGYWQFLPGKGEMPRYLAEGNQPGDPAQQTQYVLKRLNEIMPGFSTSTDTDAQLAAITKFESSGQGTEYYARGLSAAKQYVASSASAQPASPGATTPTKSIQSAGASSNTSTVHNHGDVNVNGDIVVNAPMREGGAIGKSVTDQIQSLTPLAGPANRGLE